MPRTSVTAIEQAQSDERYLPALALALVNQPRATLQELASSIGVSKATLYRFCRTKEQLIERLFAHVADFYTEALTKSRLADDSAQEALHRLILNHMDNKEFTIFIIYHWRPEFLNEDHHDRSWIDGQNALDVFFLSGQSRGEFRIDISAAAMTEIFYNVLGGLIDAERRGRVPRSGLAQLIELSLRSCICKS